MTWPDDYYKGPPDDESRQHYATTRTQDWQRARAVRGIPITFQQLLRVFVASGEMYDRGLRLRDDRETKPGAQAA